MTMSISSRDLPAEDLLRHRPRLLGLAYRMLGDMDDAEDVVQDAFLRWHQGDRGEVRSAEAWLVTVVTRLAVDRLRHAAVERATYVGPWLPEPVAVEPVAVEPVGAPAAPSTLPPPDRAAELASDLSVALLVLLERLTPEERAAFLLREVFGTDYAEIARILERRPDAVRQMVHRARERVHAGRPRVATSPEEHARLLERFLTALAADDAPALLALLAPDVSLTADSGGRAVAARRVITGSDPVARALLGITRKLQGSYSHRPTRLNGQPALLSYDESGALATVTMIDVEGGRVRAVYFVRNPEKLRRIARGEAIAIA